MNILAQSKLIMLYLSAGISIEGRITSTSSTVNFKCLKLAPIDSLLQFLEKPCHDAYSFEEYRILSKKGEGTFSEVLKCQLKQDGSYWACKKMKQRYDRLDPKFLNNTAI